MVDKSVDFKGATGVIFDPQRITDEAIDAIGARFVLGFHELQKEFLRGPFLFRKVISVEPKESGINFQIITIKAPKAPNREMKISSYWLLPIFIDK